MCEHNLASFAHQGAPHILVHLIAKTLAAWAFSVNVLMVPLAILKSKVDNVTFDQVSKLICWYGTYSQDTESLNHTPNTTEDFGSCEILQMQSGRGDSSLISFGFYLVSWS